MFFEWTSTKDAIKVLYEKGLLNRMAEEEEEEKVGLRRQRQPVYIFELNERQTN